VISLRRTYPLSELDEQSLIGWTVIEQAAQSSDKSNCSAMPDFAPEV
jgi:hypothetical protein